MYLVFIYCVEVIGIALEENDQTFSFAQEIEFLSPRLLILYLIYVMALSKS